jgi:hypothetical protein
MKDTYREGETQKKSKSVAILRMRQQLRLTVVRWSMVAPCERAHHVVEDEK